MTRGVCYYSSTTGLRLSMDKKRSSRVPTRPPHASNHNGVSHGGSSDDDDIEAAAANKQPQRTSARRQPKVDLGKLEMTSLQKYRKHFKLVEAPPNAPKEELIPVVSRHFAAQVIDEEDTLLLNFAIALKRHSLQRQPPGPPKKPRNGSKPRR